MADGDLKKGTRVFVVLDCIPVERDGNAFRRVIVRGVYADELDAPPPLDCATRNTVGVFAGLDHQVPAFLIAYPGEGNPSGDDAPAELAEIRKLCADADRLELAGNMDGALLLSAVLAGKVPRLLAMAGAGLNLHGCEPWYAAASDCGHPEPEDDMSDEWQDWDDSHVTGSGGILVCRLTQEASFCPECTRLKHGDEEPSGDDFVPAPCPTRSAVLAGLTGEEKSGGR